MGRKIAIIGTAPTSFQQAPVDDPSWEIWTGAPGCRILKRVDRWYEVHAISDYDYYALAPGYLLFLENFRGPLYMLEPDAERFPASIQFETAPLIEEFSADVLAGAANWQLAQAITEQPAEIGLWGIDCSHTEEWHRQRWGIRALIREARKRGIAVTVPEVSKLLWPERPYGAKRDIVEASILRRIGEMKAMKAQQVAAAEKAKGQTIAINGVIDTLTDLLDEHYGRDCDTNN